MRNSTIASRASLPAASAEPLTVTKNTQRSSSMPRIRTSATMAARSRAQRSNSIAPSARGADEHEKGVERIGGAQDVACTADANAGNSAGTSPVRGGVPAGAKPPGAARYWERGQQVVGSQHRRQPGERPAYAAITREDRQSRCARRHLHCRPERDEAECHVHTA